MTEGCWLVANNVDDGIKWNGIGQGFRFFKGA